MRGTPKFLLAWIILITGATQSYADNNREIQRRFVADGVNALSIEAAVGSVSITAGDPGEITVLVMVSPDDSWFDDGPNTEDLKSISLESENRKGKLHLSLGLPTGLDEDDIEEHWEVGVPERLEARVKIGVGRISIEGVSGGASARAGVGEVTVEVPGGSVSAHVSVGNARINSATKEPGDIDLDADVGSVSLKLNGKRIDAKRGWGPGASLQLDGSGQDKFDVSTDVGNATITIGGG